MGKISYTYVHLCVYVCFVVRILDIGAQVFTVAITSIRNTFKWLCYTCLRVSTSAVFDLLVCVTAYTQKGVSTSVVFKHFHALMSSYALTLHALLSNHGWLDVA